VQHKDPQGLIFRLDFILILNIVQINRSKNVPNRSEIELYKTSITAINDSGKFLNKFEEFGASNFFKESAGIFRNPESLN
jgi:hypothetical protein